MVGRATERVTSSIMYDEGKRTRMISSGRTETLPQRRPNDDRAMPIGFWVCKLLRLSVVRRFTNAVICGICGLVGNDEMVFPI